MPDIKIEREDDDGKGRYVARTQKRLQDHSDLPLREGAVS